MNKFDLKRKQETLNALKSLNDAVEAFGEYLLKTWQQGAKYSVNSEERAIIGADISWESSGGYAICNVTAENNLYQRVTLDDAIYIVENQVPFYRFWQYVNSGDNGTDFIYYDLNWVEYSEKKKQCERVIEKWGLENARISYRYGAEEFYFWIEEKRYMLFFNEIDNIERTKMPLDEAVKYVEEQYKEYKDRIIVCTKEQKRPNITTN